MPRTRPNHGTSILGRHGVRAELEARRHIERAACPLCERVGAPMEKHHLRTQREGSEVACICRECHKTIHGLYTLTELRRGDLSTVDGLRSESKFNQALIHIRKVEPGVFMKMRQARHRRGRS